MRELGNVGRAWPWAWETRVVFAVIVCVFCDHLTHASVNIPATHSHRVDTSDQSLSEVDQRRGELVKQIYYGIMWCVISRIIQNKMPHSVGWNRDFRYRRNSGATMRMRVERPVGLFNALTMTVLFNYFL